MRFSLREKGDVVIMDLAGEVRLTEDSTPSLQEMLVEQLASGKRKILLNFAKVEFIDSYGIGDIVAGYIAVKEKNGIMKFARLSDKIWLIFNYSGLTKIFEIFDSEEKALKSFA
jgi:anti-anti-sigma factor